MSSQSQPESTARRRKTLRYSVVFSPEASTESLRMDYEPKEILEDTDDVAPSAHSRLWTILNTIVLQILNVGILLPLAFGWKVVTRCLHTLGFQIRGAPFLLHCLSFFFFRPLGFILPLLEKALKIVTCGYISFDGPTFRHLVGMTLNGFGFAWHAVLDTLATPPSQWAGALERFQTFLEDNGLDLEMKLALGPRFLDNLAVYDDVQGMLGLGADRRVQDTKLDSTQLAKLEQSQSSPPQNNNNNIPSMSEAAHFMHFATAAYGGAVIFGTLLETDDQEGIDRVNRLGGRSDGVDDQNQVLAYLNCKKEDMVVSHLTAGGSMDVLRHYVVVDHSRKALVFAIRGTFSISGVICDWVSFSAPFCGGLGHVAMSEVAKKMWDLTKNDVLAKLQELPDDYDLVVTGHSLGAGVATLLTILLYHEKCIPNNKIRCFAFAPPPTYHPLSAAPEAVAATTAFIHGDDTVPFLSVYHLRRFFRSMAALKTATKGMSTWDFLRIDWGYDEPSQEMVEAMRKAEAQDLRAVKGSEKLAIPAQAVVWMQKGSSTEHPDAFHASICDARKLSELPIRVPTSQRHMLEHHLASKYEIALQGVQQQPEKDKEQ